MTPIAIKTDPLLLDRGEGVPIAMCSPPAHPPPSPSQAALEEGGQSASGNEEATGCCGGGEGVYGRWTDRPY